MARIYVRGAVLHSGEQAELLYSYGAKERCYAPGTRMFRSSNVPDRELLSVFFGADNSRSKYSELGMSRIGRENTAPKPEKCPGSIVKRFKAPSAVPPPPPSSHAPSGDKPKVVELNGHVGFDSIPHQIVKKCIEQGFVVLSIHIFPDHERSRKLRMRSTLDKFFF